MGIDVEDIKLCVCRLVHLSLRVSHRFVQKHPFVSATLLFLFILYIFLPSVLSFLFYSLPFLGLTAVLFAFWTSKRSTIRGEKVEDKKLEVSKRSAATIHRNRSVYLRNATSRRQRFKEKSDAWRTESPINAPLVRTDDSIESDNLKSLNEVKETQTLDSGNNASAHSTSVDKDIEVSSKNEPILGSELFARPDPVVCDGSSSQTNKSDSGCDETKNESSEDPEDEDEEEAQEDRNKAVEWTEDDQKNLMDLGLSEIERNRRLESLIARRRARKSYKRKNDEIALTVHFHPPGQIPKIITTRNDPLDLADGCIEGIPLPGSAPSVLLPMRNPFDLPYDPHEEKPNLMADSFQQEFTAAHQKELAFCRHESFCFGPAVPEESGGMGFHHPRYRRPSISIADKGEHDWLIEQLLFRGDQAPRAEKKPISIETRGIQTEDSPHARDVSAMELESDQEKEIPPDSESEFEMEPELMQDGSSPSSHSSSSDNHEGMICDDVKVVSKSLESTLSSALNKSLNCRVPKSRLIKEPLCDFSPTAFDKNKMEERFPYSDKVPCHTPTYSIASDLQVEVSEIGSPPTVDGNNTDGESLNHDWEIEKEASFGGEQDDIMSPLSELQSNKIILDLQEEEVKALSDTEASSPKTIQSPTAEELVDHPSHGFPQMAEELSILTDDEEAIIHIMDQKDPEAPADMENTVKPREDVDGGLEILMKQEDEGKKTRSLEESDLKSSKSCNDGSEDSFGRQSHSDHEHLEEESTNIDQITGNGGLSWAHEHSEEGSKNMDQITGNRDLGCAQEHSEESKSTDQVTGTGNLVEPRKIEEQLELIQDNKNQLNVVETEFQSSRDALKFPLEVDWDTYGGVPLVCNDIICSDASENQLNAVQIEFQKSDGDLVEPRKIEEALELQQDSKNQPNVVEIEFQSSKDPLKTTVEDNPVTCGGVPLDSNDIIRSDASQNQLDAVQSEFQKSNDAMKSTVEQDSVIERELLDTKAGLSSKSSIEDQVRMDNKVSLLQDSIISPENNPKTMAKDNINLADSVEVESEFIKDLTEQKGEKSNSDAKDDREKTDQNLSSPNSSPNDDLKISEITVQEEVTANPLINETIDKEFQVETVVTLSNKNIEAVGDDKIECETDRFNKQEPDFAEERDLEFDKDMENYSKENGIGLGLQKPIDLAHENSVESSLSADKGSQ